MASREASTISGEGSRGTAAGGAGASAGPAAGRGAGRAAPAAAARRATPAPAPRPAARPPPPARPGPLAAAGAAPRPVPDPLADAGRADGGGEPLGGAGLDGRLVDRWSVRESFGVRAMAVALGCGVRGGRAATAP